MTASDKTNEYEREYVKSAITSLVKKSDFMI